VKIHIALASLLVLTACPGDDDPDPPDFEWSTAADLDDGAILSFWGNSADDVFAVGGSMLEGGGSSIVLRHQPGAWERMTVTAPTLWWVHGFSSTDVWAVGELGTIMHFDGNDWTTEQTGDDYTLWGVWGPSPSEMWAVGGTLGGGVPSTLLHYDGSTWSEVPDIGLDGELLFKVWGPSANDVYIVGNRGALLHYDGNDWTRLDSGTDLQLLTLRGRAADDIYAVGGISSALMLHYDGTDWVETDTTIAAALMGVWTAPGAPVAISGFGGAVAISDAAGFHRQETPTYDDLHAVWGDGNGNFLAGGGNLLTIGARKGVVIAAGDIAADALP
jgi:hypothetical protein